MLCFASQAPLPARMGVVPHSELPQARPGEGRAQSERAARPWARFCVRLNSPSPAAQPTADLGARRREAASGSRLAPRTTSRRGRDRRFNRDGDLGPTGPTVLTLRGRSYAVRPFRALLNPMKAVPAKPMSSMAQVDASGIACCIPCAHRACTGFVGWTSSQ
jgi:hypothetical protein